jgi:hypothetical protein
LKLLRSETFDRGRVSGWWCIGLKWRVWWWSIWWFGDESGIWGWYRGKVRAAVKIKVGFVVNLVFLELR